jgi:hypothetical protein
MQYDRVLVFTKKGNLLGYLNTGKVAKTFSNANAESLKEYYGQEREVQLIARVRWETNGQYGKDKCFCSIKCPVSPLPVKGEFELPSLESLRAYLTANGWKLKNDMCACWFK